MPGKTPRIGTSRIVVLQAFPDEKACHDYLEENRWPNGVHCLKCDHDRVSKFTAKGKTRIDKNGVSKTGPNRHMYQCLKCKYKFQATTGTVFSDTHLPLLTWFMAAALLCNAKKGLAAKQLERDLDISYKTAWYLAHRLREAMLDGGGIFGGKLELDETHIGGRTTPPR